jgi:hypothetical protein
MALAVATSASMNRLRVIIAAGLAGGFLTAQGLVAPVALRIVLAVLGGACVGATLLFAQRLRGPSG